VAVATERCRNKECKVFQIWYRATTGNLSGAISVGAEPRKLDYGVTGR